MAADPEEALRSTSAKANFQRLSRLLMCGGLSLLREKLDSFHSPADLPIKLTDPAVQALLRSAKLTRPEWNCLYPSPGVYGKSADFDITLTFRLLRTICNLTPPPTGWDVLPMDADLSLEADLARLKYYRNEVYSHSKTMEIPDAEFVDLWTEISRSLLRIAASISPAQRDNWKEAINKFLHDRLTPEEKRYADELTSWYEKDIDVKRAVEEMQQELRRLREDTRQAQQSVEMLIISTIESIVQGGMVVTPCTQAAVGSEGRCIVLIAPEQEQAAGEIAGNRRNIPAEIDIWNVILSFKNSLALFLRYLGEKLNVTVRHHDLGSLLITVECSSSQILKGLWKDNSSGHLNEVAQETLVTAEVLEKLDLTEVRLKTFISEEEYKKGKKIFMENSVLSDQNPALEEQVDRGNKGQLKSQHPVFTTTTGKEEHCDVWPCKPETSIFLVSNKDSDQEALQKLNKNEEYLQRISKLEAENIELRERLIAIERVLKLDKAPSKQGCVSEEETTGESPGSGPDFSSILGEQATSTEKEKRTRMEDWDRRSQVSFLYGNVSTRETLFFDVATGKLVMSKILSCDKAVAVEMNREATGGFFVLYGSVSVQCTML